MSEVSDLGNHHSASFMASKLSSKLVVILGSTGTGKTDLSLRIAQKFNGEIINADSMQIYKSLDILTNKPTQGELLSCTHHLFNALNPNERCNAFQYQQMALPIIHQIHSNGKLPILVGGTHCYIESVLFHYLIPKSQNPMVPGCPDLGKLEEEEPKKVHSLLKQIDPISASLVHPNDMRKALRALEIFYATGKPLSEHLSEQKQEPGIESPTGPLRFEDPCIIFLDCERTALYERIDRRVDGMIDRGLIEEVEQFYVNEYLNSPEEMRARGLLQSIGFKEWLPYLEEWHKGAELTPDLINACIEKLKRQTRNYARCQLSWVRNRYITKHGERGISRFYKLDTTDLMQWENNVGRLSDDVLSAYLRDELPREVTPIIHTSPVSDNKSYNFCDRCQIVLLGDTLFRSHMKSRRHYKRGVKLKRLQNLLKNHEIQKSSIESSEKEEIVLQEKKDEILLDLKGLF